MGNDELTLKDFLSKKNILILLLICAGALFLNLRGISFGLPSEERMKISLGGREEVEKMLPAIRSALKRNIAERSEAFEKKAENFTELAKLSPYFDQVRSNNPDEFFTFKNITHMVKNRTACPSMFNYGPFYYYQVGGLSLSANCWALSTPPMTRNIICSIPQKWRRSIWPGGY